MAELPVRWAALALLICAVAIGGAAEPEPSQKAANSPSASVTWSADPAQVAVGGELTVNLELRWPSAWTVISEPEPGRLLVDGYILELPLAEHIDDGAVVQKRWAISCLARRSGPWALPEATLVLQDASGTEHRIISGETVVLVGSDAPPLELPAAAGFYRGAEDERSAAFPWWIVAGVALLLGAGLITALALRRQTPVERSAHERFRDELAALAAAADGKQAGALLSRALRAYLGERHGFDGIATTTRELRRRCEPHLPADSLGSLIRLCERLDALRWAPDDCDPQLVKPLTDGARDWVDAEERRLAALVESPEAERP